MYYHVLSSLFITWSLLLLILTYPAPKVPMYLFVKFFLEKTPLCRSVWHGFESHWMGDWLSGVVRIKGVRFINLVVIYLGCVCILKLWSGELYLKLWALVMSFKTALPQVTKNIQLYFNIKQLRSLGKL